MLVSSWFTRRIPPANNMHSWCFHDIKQCTGKRIPAYVITNISICIVLQAKVPIAPARNPHSLKNASRVARKCKQPCSSLHHCIASIYSPKQTASVFLPCPVHYKCFLFTFPNNLNLDHQAIHKKASSIGLNLHVPPPSTLHLHTSAAVQRPSAS